MKMKEKIIKILLYTGLVIETVYNAMSRILISWIILLKPELAEHDGEVEL